MSKIKQHPALALMLKEADGFLTRYTEDLTRIDAGVLAEMDPAEPFMWILRDSGTHLARSFAMLTERDHRRNLGTASHYAAMVESSFGHHEIRYFWWDGRALIRYKSAKALDERMAVQEASIDECHRRGTLAG
jgi:hypothetical protein